MFCRLLEVSLLLLLVQSFMPMTQFLGFQSESNLLKDYMEKQKKTINQMKCTNYVTKKSSSKKIKKSMSSCQESKTRPACLITFNSTCLSKLFRKLFQNSKRPLRSFNRPLKLTNKDFNRPLKLMNKDLKRSRLENEKRNMAGT